MLRILRIASLVVFISLASDVCRAQLVAFPGAEGAGRLATGGRGGDVYHVTNLLNTGAGSLRNGITSAPATGRTIVFDVDGTIHLASVLSISGKSKITIAGQTAPGGGITIADQATVVNNSNNIVMQHLRFRPGSTFGNTDPDAVSVTGSNNVMIDHVTATWGVDETISITSQSNNVTVQWSQMTQGLFNAGHTDTDGVGHSYGSLLNGGLYTFSHNLYAHSKSRQPRPQWNTGEALHLQLDWVNNVMYNPGDKFGYSDDDDPYTMNMVGNYGIKGPQTNSSNNFMMRPADVDSQFYVEGNYMDIDSDLVLDGNPVNGTAAFGASDLKTIVGSRFNFPQVTTDTADQAYIQVLSRSGAIRYRDSIDRRTIRTIFNQLPGQIDTQANWGGWPTLPTGVAAADANADGVPNAWATANGFSTSTPLNTTFAPDGYTYLEKYVQSLTPNAFTPTNTVQHTIRTGFGAGADAFVGENGGDGATSSGNGSGATLDAVWGGSGGATNQAILLRFDLSQVVPGSLTSARLDLTAASAISGSHTFMVYGLEQDAAGWDWNESTVEFSGAPGLAFNNDSGTLGINNTFTTTSHPDNPNVLTLGQITINSTAAGATVSLTNPNLAAFLNLAAYYQGISSENVVTLLLQQTTSGSAASFYSKEGDSLLAPSLVIDALLQPAPPVLAGDFNGDGFVDAADYTVWRDNLGNNIALTNETASLGVVDLEDYDAWKANFGASAGSGSSGDAISRVAVPEPASVILAVGTILLGACLGGRRVRAAR